MGQPPAKTSVKGRAAPGRRRHGQKRSAGIVASGIGGSRQSSRTFGSKPHQCVAGRIIGKGLADAARFWEPRRLLYNLLLAGVVLVCVTKTWPQFRPAITLESLGIMTVLALLATYLAEVLVQNATSRAAWNRQRDGRLGRRYAAGDPFRK